MNRSNNNNDNNNNNNNTNNYENNNNNKLRRGILEYIGDALCVYCLTKQDLTRR